MEMIARLRSGVSQEKAQAELTQISAGLADKYRDTNSGRALVFTPLREQIVGRARPALYLLMAAVGAVLLAACVNLSNLMMGRMSAREQELAVRAALGASRFRLLRQLLVESTLLVGLGGAAGILLARWFLPRLMGMIDTRLPGAETMGIHAEALGFAVLLSLLTGVASGLLPARALWQSRREENLHGAGRATAGANRARLRKSLVVAEIALSSMLLAGAGLLGSSLLALLNVRPGFDPSGLLTFKLTLSDSRYQTRAQIAATLTQLTQRIEQLPGVTRATVTGSLPLGNNNIGTSVWVEGRILPAGQQPPMARWQYVQQGYFQAMGIRLLRGRAFEERDIARKPHVTVISESMARRDFPGEDPLGRRVSFGPQGGNADWHEIIGIVDDVRHDSMRETPFPRAYDLFGQHAGMSAFAAVRTARSAEQVIPEVRAILRELDPGAPVYTVRSMQQWIDQSVSGERALTILLGIFALAALFLGAVGAYGVISSLVEQRTREIGIRIALGASPRAILNATMGEGLRLAALGLVIGLAVSLGLAPMLRQILFGVGPSDPRTFLTVTVVLLGVALAASYVPARRAARVDPMTALRQE